MMAFRRIAGARCAIRKLNATASILNAKALAILSDEEAGVSVVLQIGAHYALPAVEVLDVFGVTLE